VEAGEKERKKTDPGPPPPSPQAGKAQLSSLATSVMRLVDAVVSQTESDLDAGGAALQAVLAAGADAAGEWHLPLDDDALARMREVCVCVGGGGGEESARAAARPSTHPSPPSPPQALDARADLLDEAFLSNTFAWMRKASGDGEGGVVALIQTALQLYAARALAPSPAPTAAADAALHAVLAAPEKDWGARIAEAVAAGVPRGAVDAALRRRSERVALGLPSGSYAQRVQAEYLKEVGERVAAGYGGGE